MRLKDALFNWLQIKIVQETRPFDSSAKDTVGFFQTVLAEDHQVTDLQMNLKSNEYLITFNQQGQEQSHAFSAELAEKLLKDITEEPKYNQCL
jgi:hypothetical protein